MADDSGYEVPAPPRYLPPLVKYPMYLAGFSLLGWIFLGFGMIFVWVFMGRADLTSWYYFSGEIVTTEGSAVSCENTGGKSGRTPIFANRYTFSGPDGTAMVGVSYATGGRLQPGDSVEVEYPVGKPEVSRIAGMRRAPFGPLSLIALIFPGIGIGMIISGARKGRKAAWLLEKGELGLGTLKSKEPTEMTVNDQTVYRVIFEFTASDGSTYTATAETHRPQDFEDQEYEGLLYDPGNPSYAMMYHDLPLAPAFGEMGNIRPSSPAENLILLAIPAIVLLGHGTYAVMRFLG